MHTFARALRLTCLAGVAGCLLLPMPASADDVTLSPVADATLYFFASGDFGGGFGANGAGDHLFAGVGNDAKRALLRFDLSAIPSGSTIDSVELTLNMSRTITDEQDVDLHRLTTAWSEGPTDPPGEEGAGGPAAAGDSTWDHTNFPTDLWTTPGGDFVAMPSATTSVNLEGFYTWGPSAGLAADVQAWIDDPLSNFGWILIGPEGGPQTAKRFDSRENPTAGVQPALFVVYTPGGASVEEIPTLDPRALALLALLLVVVGAALLRRAV